MNISKMTPEIIDKLSFRLPTYIKPSCYNLWLNPNLEKETFTGRVTIDLEVLEPSTFIVLHSKFLEINQTGLKQLLPNGADKPIKILNSFDYQPHEYFVIETEDIDAGDYVLNLDFSGTLAKKIVGFYSSSYVDKSNGERRRIISSKFEPTFARQCFPCFDEPAMKTKYKVQIVTPDKPGYLALSNMNEKRTILEPGNGLKTVEFEESVKMSTYLSAFIVSDFAYVEEIVSPKKDLGTDFPLRVYATREQIQKGATDFAKNTAKKIIEHYIDYFQIGYPMPKLDLAAIPDFPSGAMETWGLVTFRETSILYDPKSSSTTNKQRVATVIAHELAHMWFGNLVTMKWWNDLWLNEGFASYIEYKGTDFAYPEWGIKEQFIIDDMHPVLSLDATFGSHPIVQKVETPDQITEIFDLITYQKGASIIRMFEGFLGESIFKEGVTKYLKVNAYDNAETLDLVNQWNELFKDEDVEELVGTWTKQKGFPVVNVIREKGKVILTQKRFLANPDNKLEDDESSEFGYKWSIPITYFTSKSSGLQKFTFNFKENKREVEMADDVDWIKLNKDQVGYYRVNYPEDMWKKFDFTAFSIGDRCNLLNDAFNLADAQQLDYNVALDLTKYLVNENQYVPWSVAMSTFKKIGGLIENSESFNNLMNYARYIVKNIYEKVGWDVPSDESGHMENRLRAIILDFVCSETVNDENALKIAKEKFKIWLSNPEKNPIHPDLRTVIYYYGMKASNDENDWNTVFEMFKKENDPQEKSKLMLALAGIPNKEVLKRYIELAKDETVVRRQDLLILLAYIAQNKCGEKLVWDYVRESWPELIDMFGLGERNLGRLIPNISKKFATTEKKEEMLAFFNKYPDSGAGLSARKQALENIENNMKWLCNNEKVITEWLANFKL